MKGSRDLLESSISCSALAVLQWSSAKASALGRKFSKGKREGSIKRKKSKKAYFIIYRIDRMHNDSNTIHRFSSTPRACKLLQ